MKKPALSATETEILTLVEMGSTIDEIKEMNLTEFPEALLERAIDKVSKAELLQKYPSVFMRVHGAQGENLDELEDELTVSAKALGLPKKVIQAIKRRIKAHKGDTRKVETLNDRQMVEELQKKATLALSYIDEFSLSGSSAKDVSSVYETLIKNAQLLQGKPTAISSIEDRRKIEQLLPVLLQEAKRRGMVIDAQFTEIPRETN